MVKQYEQSILMYDEALKIDPKDADVYYNKGRSIDIIKIINRLFVA